MDSEILVINRLCNTPTFRFLTNFENSRPPCLLFGRKGNPGHIPALTGLSSMLLFTIQTLAMAFCPGKFSKRVLHGDVQETLRLTFLVQHCIQTD